jgi:hypothetical protein
MRIVPTGIVRSFAVAILFALGHSPGTGLAQTERTETRGVSQSRDPRTLAARIDSVLSARWAENQVQPAATADDGEFLRRVSLDVVGRIPTAAEARDFLDDPRAEKRLALVERALESPAYIKRAAELWREVLLPEADTDDAARAVAPGLEAWLKKRVAEEAGYDRIVREILTAKLDLARSDEDASAVRGDVSPVGYFVAKGRQPENLAAGTARVFLGIRLECAQCHNHPFAKWKREEFWQLAAFFADVAPPAAFERTMSARETAPRRELAIPGTKTVVQAKFLDGEAPAWRPRVDSREYLAQWITRPENPYFARAVVNRVWSRFFGVGLVEPVDDIEAEGDAALAGLLSELATEFREHNYNLKYLIRVLTATRAYQLSSEAPAADKTPPSMFASMPVRGLTPGQLFDSLARATGGRGAEHRARFLELFANRDERPIDAQTTILQALAMMNGAYVDGATRPETGDILGAVSDAPFLDTQGRIEALFLASLTRRPTPEEATKLIAYVDCEADEEARTQALADVFWAILNGPEFRLNH